MTRRQQPAAVGPPPPPENLRLSKATRDQIATLKRRTGIKHMNVLCRWALCRSLAEPVPPPHAETDTVVEIAWKVFAGPAGPLWWALLLMKESHAAPAGPPLEAEHAAALLRAHVARGMSYLVGDPDVRDATSLARLALQPA